MAKSARTRRSNPKGRPDESIGPRNLVTCPFCNKQVTKRKTKAYHGGRVCREHACAFCGQPVRPDHTIHVGGFRVCRSHVRKGEIDGS